MYYKFYIKQINLELGAVQQIYVHKITIFWYIGWLAISDVGIFRQNLSSFHVLK